MTNPDRVQRLNLQFDLIVFDYDAGALAAGMTVFGFHGGSHCRPGYADKLHAAGAVMTFDDMRYLPGL